VYELYIANKNYSSWSLRPWVLLRELKIPFAERLLRFGDLAAWDRFRAISPSGKVPCLIDGPLVIWDSLAIAEYLAERHAGIWPSMSVARAWARSAAAEMHSGFQELRGRCSMSCGVRIRLTHRSAALDHELARLAALWTDGIERFGGPFLAGSAFTAVDAFFAPVAFRVQTYGLALEAIPTAYVQTLLELGAMRAWYADALRESFRDLPHEVDIGAAGTLLEDFRAPVQTGH
jgi:glutathione S-transferase